MEPGFDERRGQVGTGLVVMNKVFVFLLFCFSGFSSLAQLSCDDFKEGVFITEQESPVQFKIEIVRTATSQTERIIEPSRELIESGYPYQKVSHITLKWIDDCSYRMMYDKEKGSLSEIEQFINDSGGALVQFTDIDGSCIFYKSSMKINGELEWISGKMCKIK
ncbi:hypothetical protein [Leeuwenhoekiella nanhaiensis]|nr:hypothetical protein [Leeuwenhoekiella nanhaiensis]